MRSVRRFEHSAGDYSRRSQRLLTRMKRSSLPIEPFPNSSSSKRGKSIDYAAKGDASTGKREILVGERSECVGSEHDFAQTIGI